MTDKWKMIRKYTPWLGLLLGMDVGFCLFLWLADVRSFLALLVAILLCSLILFAIVVSFVIHRETRYRQALEVFLDAPSESNERAVLAMCSPSDQEMVEMIGQILRNEKYAYRQLLVRVNDYEEYVEAWAHETKMPISLLSLLIDNHSDEIPQPLVTKMDYIRSRMQAYVDQMLFYARMKSDKNDIYFEYIPLAECLQDVINDYRPLLDEKQMTVTMEDVDVKVYSDKRALRFIVGQILSNAIKYARNDVSPKLSIRCQETEGKRWLSFSDNGIGVKACDLPYIFEKGFTGDSGENRKKATGMGLYIAGELAKKLKLEMDAESKWMVGFTIVIRFPNM